LEGLAVARFIAENAGFLGIRARNLNVRLEHQCLTRCIVTGEVTVHVVVAGLVLELCHHTVTLVRDRTARGAFRAQEHDRGRKLGYSADFACLASGAILRVDSLDFTGESD